ncbi:MAG: hypothetical protein GEV06_24905 [Luteitalea sp.]|nr:hypothetical protein [Luteitalea sp.]
MSTHANMSALEEARGRWNCGDLDGYLRLYSADAVLHGYANVPPWLSGIRQFYEGFCSAFPRSQIVFEDVFAADDRVACRFVIRRSTWASSRVYRLQGNRSIYQESPS